ncbi:unnamed protein product [Adineta steineri]|uniref:Uncharacterized protein n=1 Tax=Adineta steineri TaxID=433720 RepID=A0A813S3C9_9BILA|nr:unnamed protein product [Adineta steineri]CAF3696572.1 unnamed protein product [Adineta steineri]
MPFRKKISTVNLQKQETSKRNTLNLMNCTISSNDSYSYSYPESQHLQTNFIVFSNDTYPYPGLRHLRTNFKCQIVIAQRLNKTMVFPKTVGIPKYHSQSFLYPNQKKFIEIPTESIINIKLLSSYFDIVSYDDVTINQNNSGICSFDSLPLVQKYRYCCWQELCSYNPPRFSTKYSMQHIEDNFHRHQQPIYLLKLAHKLISKIKPDFYIAIHIRRGDQLKKPRFQNKLDSCTRPSWIREKLNSYGISNGSIYLATNEYKPNFFHSLSQWYTIYTIQNFSMYINETIKQNPYAVVIIDEIIYSNAKVKFSTFIEPYTNLSFCPFGRAGFPKQNGTSNLVKHVVSKILAKILGTDK